MTEDRSLLDYAYVVLKWRRMIVVSAVSVALFASSSHFAAIEIVSALHRLTRSGRIAPQRGEAALSAFLALEIRWSHRRDILPLAWELARRFDRPTAYDAAYLALAQLHDCEFWTADERLYNAVKPELPWVRWLGELRPRAS